LRAGGLPPTSPRFSEFVGAFTLIFVGVGSIVFGSNSLVGVAAIAYDRLYLGPERTQPVGAPGTGLIEPRPGDAAVS
jgi:hypothetical protein